MTVQEELWRRNSDRVLLHVRPISERGRALNKGQGFLRVRPQNRKTWSTWHPDYLREQATKVES